jgi:hypothetical protein
MREAAHHFRRTHTQYTPFQAQTLWTAETAVGALCHAVCPAQSVRCAPPARVNMKIIFIMSNMSNMSRSVSGSVSAMHSTCKSQIRRICQICSVSQNHMCVSIIWHMYVLCENDRMISKYIFIYMVLENPTNMSCSVSGSVSAMRSACKSQIEEGLAN